MNRSRLYSLLLVFSSFIKPAVSQNFELLKTYGTKLNKEYICSISAEPTAGCVFLLEQKDSGVVNSSTGPDTLQFDTSRFIYSTTNNRAMYLVRLDHNGKVVKTRNIGTFNSLNAIPSNSGFTFYAGISSDYKGNIYITGNLPSGIQNVGGKYLNSNNGKILFAKFDKDFNLIWATQTGNSTNSLPGNIVYSAGHVYFYCSSADITPIWKNSYSFSKPYNATASKNRTYVYGELKQSDGNILWSKYLFITPPGAVLEITGMLNLKNKLYLTGNNYPDFIIGNDTLLPGSFIVEADTAGNYKKNFMITAKRKTFISCIATDGEHLYIGGAFTDSLTWGKQKIAPQFPTGQFLVNQAQEQFAASITASLQPRWFYHPKILDSTAKTGSTPYGANYLTSVSCSNGHLYYGGSLAIKSLFGSDTLKAPSGWFSQSIIFKIDYLGNVLWATSGGSDGYSLGNVSTISAIAEQSVFSGGVCQGKIKYGKYTDSSKKYKGVYTYDAWLTKVTDYYITRGKVGAGPYCAGDTIQVPYSKKGNFDTSNYFIAELSDELGNFETGYRELGRLKTNKDSVVPGILPMFKVASSPYYRIRIRSTNPKVQSYYFLDTLRLLIYSRDKANPGLPETICKGDSIKLNTYGGTKAL